MASRMIQSYRSGAEMYNGDAFCKKKSIQLLEEIDLPNGLFPVDDIEEFGYNCDIVFVWLIQKKNKDHTFKKKIKKAVSYAPEVKTFVENGKMKKMTGVKTNELMLWLSVVEMYIEDRSLKKITFKTSTGVSDSFPIFAFKLCLY
ncbi:At5g01610-like protein [Dioscorea alata]|uniref:At5g01610-like protein n=1 Tax=Dioscorea alata TaxID=55571 RepID=A0ACB7TQM2_DIOAL|nr:At5g01610-like protein [Dioscorea alata]